jgi:hypothetical protein
LGPGRRECLESVYFDTPKSKLRNHGLTFRVRRSGKRHLQTIKATRRGANGAFGRGEWEQEISGNSTEPNSVEGLRYRAVRNVELRVGDGTRGWPEAAPFDAILVSASGSRVPTALREQLALGGRLVMPVGRPGQRFRQTLLKLKRLSATEYEEHDLGPVAFVPLVSAELEAPRKLTDA